MWKDWGEGGGGRVILTTANFLLSWPSQKTEMDFLDVSSLCKGNLRFTAFITQEQCLLSLVIHTLLVLDTLLC